MYTDLQDDFVIQYIDLNTYIFLPKITDKLQSLLFPIFDKFFDNVNYFLLFITYPNLGA